MLNTWCSALLPYSLENTPTFQHTQHDYQHQCRDTYADENIQIPKRHTSKAFIEPLHGIELTGVWMLNFLFQLQLVFLVLHIHIKSPIKAAGDHRCGLLSDF